MHLKSPGLSSPSPLEALATRTSEEGESLQLHPPHCLPGTHAEQLGSTPPHSPLLHARFRASVATDFTMEPHDFNPAADVGASPSSPSWSSLGDSTLSMPIAYPSTPSSAASRAPVKYRAEPSTNFSRPRAPRTPAEERAKQEVLQRVSHSRSVEHLSAGVQPTSLHHTSYNTRLQDSDPSATSLRRPYLSPPTTTLHAKHMAVTTPNFSPNSSSSVDPHGHTRPWIVPQLTRDHSTTLSSSPVSSNSVFEATSPSSNSSHAQSDFPLTPQSQRPSVQAPALAIAREDPYERYSYYELPSPLPSPECLKPTHSLLTPPARIGACPVSSPPSSSTSTEKPRSDPHTPEEFLMLAIEIHLQESASSLSQSAQYFQLSATLNGGCGFGMLMWGLCLRHGWGVEKDEHRGFMWLRKACELAVGELEGSDLKGIGRQSAEKPSLPLKEIRHEMKAELTLAIYEVGQCFFRGWGVPRDRSTGFQYFLVAARLGDMDAQQELGYCYSNGKGCKKDRKEAARWYRAAAEQGASTVGMAWIYKDKFI